MRIYLFLLVFAALVHAQSAKELLDRVISVYGGEKALEHGLAYEQIWHVKRASDSVSGSEYRRVFFPHRLYSKLTYPDRTETRALEKNGALRSVNNRKSTAKGIVKDAMKLQLMRLYSPLMLKTKKPTISDNGKEYVLTLIENNLRCEYFVDKKSFLINKCRGYIATSKGDIEFLTIYGDFKKFNGITMPTKETKFAQGIKTADLTLISNVFKNIP